MANSWWGVVFGVLGVFVLMRVGKRGGNKV